MGRRAWFALFALALAGCDEEPSAPHLAAVLPDRAAPGTAVDVVGERLQGELVQVSFAGQSAALLALEPRRLRARVPTVPGGHQLLVVTVDGRVSNPLDFTVEAGGATGP